MSLFPLDRVSVPWVSFQTFGAPWTISPAKNVAISARVIASSGLNAPPAGIIPLLASALMASWASCQTPPTSLKPPLPEPTSTPATSAALAMNTAISARVTSWFGEYVEPSPVPLVIP